MEGAVCEVDAPEPRHRSVRALGGAEKSHAAVDRLIQRRPREKRAGFAQMSQSRECGGGALDIGTLRHAVTEHLGRIHSLEPARPAPAFVRAEASVAILA